MMQRIFGAVLSIMLLGSSSAALAGGGELSSLQWPVRQDFTLFDFNDHQGVDLVTATNAPVYAATIGEVRSAICKNIDSQCRIVIQHENQGLQFRTVYGHLKNIKVAVGQQVDVDTVLGVVTKQRHDPKVKVQPHVHFALQVKDLKGEYHLTQSMYYSYYFQQ